MNTEQKPAEKYKQHMMTFSHFDKRLQRKVDTEYMQVAGRIMWLRDLYGNSASIETNVSQVGDYTIVKATLSIDEKLISTGSATVKPYAGGDIEKAETKAIGRALGFGGLGTQFAWQDINEDADDSDLSNLSDSPQQPPPAPAPQNQSKRQTAPEPKDFHNEIVTIKSLHWQPKSAGQEELVYAKINEDSQFFVWMYEEHGKMIDKMFNNDPGTTFEMVKNTYDPDNNKGLVMPDENPLEILVEYNKKDNKLRPAEYKRQNATLQNPAIYGKLWSHYRKQNIEGLMGKLETALQTKHLNECELTLPRAIEIVDGYLKAQADKMKPINEAANAWAEGGAEAWNAVVEKNKSVYGNKDKEESKQPMLLDNPPHQRAEGAD